jgi:TctA family transporter
MDIVLITLGLVLFVLMTYAAKASGRNPWTWGLLFLITGILGYIIFAVDMALRGNLNDRS